MVKLVCSIVVSEFAVPRLNPCNSMINSKSSIVIVFTRDSNCSLRCDVI